MRRAAGAWRGVAELVGVGCCKVISSGRVDAGNFGFTTNVDDKVPMMVTGTKASGSKPSFG